LLKHIDVQRMGESVKADFEHGIWRATFLNFFQNKAVVAVVVALLLGMAILKQFTGSSGSGASSFAWAILAIAAHSTILTQKSGFAGLNNNKIWLPFVLRGLFFSLMPIIGVIVGLVMFGDTGSKVAGLVFTAIVFGFFEALLLAKWGTWLPATVADGDKSFGAAGRRGNKTFGYVFGRLLGCSILLWAVAGVLAFGLTFMFVVIEPAFPQQTGSLVNDVIEWTIVTGVLVVASIQTVLLATVLSRAYLIAESRTNVSGRL
jgi:hypothetical protein